MSCLCVFFTNLIFDRNTVQYIHIVDARQSCSLHSENQGYAKPLSHIVPGKLLGKPFHLAPFHTCHGNARIDGARDSPADGGHTTLMDAKCHETQQKKKMWQGWMYVYAAEDVSLLFSGTWWVRNCFVRCQCS